MAKETTTARIPSEGLTRAETIVLLVQAFRHLEWRVEQLHPLRVVARTPAMEFSKGEKIEVELGDQGFSVSSRFVAWSPFASRHRNHRNLRILAEAFAKARSTTGPELMRSDLDELERSGVMEQDADAARANEVGLRDISTFFVPRKGFFATPLLIDASVLVYIAMVASGVHFFLPSSEDLLKWGGNFRPATLGGEWWRLLTCCFEHIGILHLLLNMYALAMAGLYLEPILGRWRMFAFYGVTGVCASLASLWWHEDTVSAGASGAIFGLYGAFLALLMTDLIHKDVRKSLLSSIGVFVVYNLAFGAKGGVDNAAHIGGLLSGMVLGFALYPALRSPQRKNLQWSSTIAASALVIGAGFALVAPLPADDHLFQERMARLSIYEEEGIRALNMPKGTTAGAQLVEVQEHSLPGWKNALQMLDSTKDLRLSAYMIERRERMRAYVKERITNMELMERLLQHPFDPEADVALRGSFDRADSLFKALTEQ